MSISDFFKRFLLILLVVLLCWGAWAARSILLSAFAAVLIAVGLGIPTQWLVRRGWPRGWAMVGAILLFLNIMLLVLLLIVPRLLSGFITLLSNIPAAFRALLGYYIELRARSPFLNGALPAPPLGGDEARIDPAQAEQLLRQLVDASLAIAPSLLGGVNTVVALTVNFVFVLFIAVFFLLEPQNYRKASLFLIPQHYHWRALEIWEKLYHTIRLWLSTIFLSISITMGLVWLILGVVLGMPNAIVVAVFAGLATFVPNIGAILPLLPITIFTLATEPERVLLYAAVYLVIQFIESNVITPTLVKSELSIPPGALMVFQLLATLAFGALGLLLAVPLLAMIIVLVRELYSYDLLRLRGAEVEAAMAAFHPDVHDEAPVDVRDEAGDMERTRSPIAVSEAPLVTTQRDDPA